MGILTGLTNVALALNLESKNNFQTALPLLFYSLWLCDNPCHRAVIMNNLAATFAQHPPLPLLMDSDDPLPRPAFASLPNGIRGNDSGSESALNRHQNTSLLSEKMTAHIGEDGGSKGETHDGPTDLRRKYLVAALNWATNSYNHTLDTSDDERTEECDHACATSLCTLGDAYLMLEKKEQARKMFERCVEMSKGMDFSEGVKNGEAGLKRCEKSK